MAASVSVELRAITGEFVAKMREASEEIEHLQKKGASSFSKLQTAGKAVFLGIAGAGAAVGGMSLELADDFEKSNARLEASIKAAGGSFEELKPKIDANNKAMEALGFTNAQTEDALSHLTVATGDPTKALGAMSVAADLARARNIDLSSASDIVGKAMAGQLKPLKALGIDLPIAAGGALNLQKAHDGLEKAQQGVNDVLAKYPDAASKASKGNAAYQKAVDKVATAQAKLSSVQGSSDAILKALTDRMGGQASTYAETFAGKVQVLKTRAEDLGVKIGLALIPVIEKLAAVTQDVVAWFQKHKEIAEVLAVAVGSVLVTAMGAYAFGVAKAAATTVADAAVMVASWVGIGEAAVVTGEETTLALGPIGIVVAAVGVAAFELYKHWDQIWGAIKTATGAAVGFVKDHIELIVAGLALPLLPLVELWKHWDSIWGAIKTATSDAVGFLGRAWDTIKSGFEGIWSGMGDFVSGIFGGIVGVLKSAINDVIDVINGAIKHMNDTTGNFDFGTGALHIPPIPHLAAGGIVTSPTVALIGEAGAEAVVPLTGSRGRAAMGGGHTFIFNVAGSIRSDKELATVVRDEFSRIAKRNGGLVF